MDAFFITLNKTEDSYSPTTMYEDYAISDRLFHWQSQSTTSIDSKTGHRYVKHREMGYTPLLFAREHRHLPSGLAAPYCFLGPAEHVRHEGSRPISIVWKLEHAMPARLLRMKDIGAKNRGLHTFRHTGATYLANDVRMPLPQLQKFLGHRDIKTTMRYLHPSADDVAQSLAAVDYSKLIGIGPIGTDTTTNAAPDTSEPTDTSEATMEDPSEPE